MEWISVKDKLPSSPDFDGCPYDHFLVYSSIHQRLPCLITIATFKDDKWVAMCDCKLGSYDCGMYDEIDLDNITHWAILTTPNRTIK